VNVSLHAAGILAAAESPFTDATNAASEHSNVAERILLKAKNENEGYQGSWMLGLTFLHNGSSTVDL
jgi:hypothetical protein